VLAVQTYADAKGTWQVGELAEGADAYVFARAAKRRGGLNIFVARDDSRAGAFRGTVEFFAPDIEVLQFPSWDCLPYDRISPSRTIAAKRAGCLHKLQHLDGDKTTILVTTINALSQKVPPRAIMGKAGLRLVPGEQIKREDLEQYFSMNGYTRASTVIEPGDYALRGSLVDVFPPGFDEPVRLDFFGDELETLRSFDADSQRSTTSHKRIDLAPVSEVFLNPESIAKFRTSYIAAFGGGLSDDPVTPPLVKVSVIKG